jgi:O-antigen/teichoic acid export membrane protein
VLSRDVVVYAWAVAGGNLVTLVAIAATVHSKIARLRPTRPEWRALKELASFGLKGQSLLLSELIVFQASKFLIGAVSGTSATGAYELGSRLALGFRTLGGLFTGALVAPLTRSFTEQGMANARERADRLTGTIAALSIVPPLLGLALAHGFLSLWLGDYAPLTLATMVALCVGFTTNMLTGVQGVLAEAIGRPGLTARSAAITAVLSLVIGTPLLLTVGPTGLVVGTGAALAIGSAYNIALVQPAVGSTQLRYYRLILGPLTVGVAASGLALASTLWMTVDDRLDAVLAVSLGTAAFLALYIPTSVLRGYLPRRYFASPWR